MKVLIFLMSLAFIGFSSGNSKSFQFSTSADSNGQKSSYSIDAQLEPNAIVILQILIRNMVLTTHEFRAEMTRKGIWMVTINGDVAETESSNPIKSNFDKIIGFTRKASRIVNFDISNIVENMKEIEALIGDTSKRISHGDL